MFHGQHDLRCLDSVICLYRRSQAELRAFLQLPPPLVAHRAAADVAVLAEILKALVTRAGVGIQDLMTLECKHTGTFVAYEGKQSHTGLY